MNSTRADTDEEEFRRLCQYFAYRAKMLQSVNKELGEGGRQAADNTGKGQSMVHSDSLCAVEGDGSVQQ